MMETKLRKHQMALLAMLHEIDRICENHGIQYMLFAGSALGAVRHRGFIPWDDDLDVVMLREEYDRFLAVAGEELSERYYLQREFSEHWPMCFSKVRKNGTACMEKFYPRDLKQHQGIYVDIFPVDALADDALTARLQFFASKVVIAKCLYLRGYLTDSLMKKLFMQFCRLLPLEPFLELVQFRGHNSTRRVHSFFGASSRYKKSVYERQWFAEVHQVPFEDGLFPISAYSEELLTTQYGDYMTLPPESEIALKTHCALLDLDQSYEHYLDWQKQQHFSIYTRSIR